MDLLNDTRTLIHTGKLLRQPETGFEWSGWTELFVLLFDNYSKSGRLGALREAHQSSSGHDQDQGERRYPQVPCEQTSTYSHFSGSF